MTKEKLINKIILTLGLIGFGYVHAQESANTSGGNATGNGGTVAYSVGQVFFTTNTESNGNVAQGVQQIFEIYSIGIVDTTMNISITAFPNPTSDNLTLQISKFNTEKLFYQLFDLQGKLLNTGHITEEQTDINTVNLPSASYFIHVVNKDNKKVQSFKLVKN